MMRWSSIVLLLFALMLLVSCNKYPYHELLPEEEGKYSILYVGVQDDRGHMKNPEALQELGYEHGVTNAYLRWDLEGAQKSYPKLELERAPVFVVFDWKGMVLKTEDEQELLEFFNTKI